MVITGTNLLAPRPAPAVTVRVQPVRRRSWHPREQHHPDVSDPVTLQVTSARQAGADGPIPVDDVHREWQVFSGTPFLVPPPDCAPAGAVGHERAITLKLKKSGAASGVVSSTEDPPFDDCVASVPVKIQRKTKGGWKNAGSATTTDTGSYT